MAATTLDHYISKAFASTGKTEDVNQVYLTLLKTTLYVPIEKDSLIEAPNVATTINSEAQSPLQPLKDFTPLCAIENNIVFMAAFDTLERLQNWASDNLANMDIVDIKGRDLVAGMGEQVHLALNAGTPYYKEFSPEEIQRLKTIVAKILSLDKANKS